VTKGGASGLEETVEHLHAASTVLITTHVNPDGDAIGSSLGLMHILESLGKSVDVVTQDGFGQRYGFLPGADRIATIADGPWDTGIAVDCGGIDRVGSVKSLLESCSTVMRIDHHPVCERFGDLEYLDPRAAAVGEMIALIADRLGAHLSPEASECLLTSIVEDTGCFQFESVSPATLRVCAMLVETGADLHSVVQAIYWRNNPGAVRMGGACLEAMRLELDGRLAWTVASLEDFGRYGTVQEDVDEVVHGLLSVDGVEIAILLRETDSDYRVSLRSRSTADVASLARQFGGGGHFHAAGCRLPRDPEAVRRLVDAAARVLA